MFVAQLAKPQKKQTNHWHCLLKNNEQTAEWKTPTQGCQWKHMFRPEARTTTVSSWSTEKWTLAELLNTEWDWGRELKAHRTHKRWFY